MTTGVAESEAEIWRTDPATLREVVLDPEAMEARLEGCPALERAWILALLGRSQDAVEQGLALLVHSADRFRPLLALALAFQHEYRWHEAARLQEEALRLARTRTREAMVRHEIGRRLFHEARYREAAAEFEWARDLYRNAGQREKAALSSQQALDRARELINMP